MNIKSPGGDVIKPKEKPQGSSGTYNGEPGYEKRTPSPNAMREKTYDGAEPKGDLSIKTPGEKSKKL